MRQARAPRRVVAGDRNHVQTLALRFGHQSPRRERPAAAERGMEMQVPAEHAVPSRAKRLPGDRLIGERPGADGHQQDDENPDLPGHGLAPNRFAATSGMNEPALGSAVARKYTSVADQPIARCTTTSAAARRAP